MTYPLKTSSVKYKYNKLNYDFKNTLQKRVRTKNQTTMSAATIPYTVIHTDHRGQCHYSLESAFMRFPPIMYR